MFISYEKEKKLSQLIDMFKKSLIFIMLKNLKTESKH